MNPLWTAADAKAATGGQGPGGWQASGVSIDTRTLQKGDLFVALQAARDGHEFVAQALEKGAAAALVSRVPEGVPETAPLLIVPDVLAGLEALGQAARARTSARIGAITGSVGKTSSKEMLRAALSGQGKIHAAEASYNNHWGVPLTLARMPADTDFGIFEIGMSAPGEIAPLAQQVRPDVALITTVAAAHFEAFGSLEGIAREKAAIARGLAPEGTLVMLADLPTAPILRAAHRGPVISFGESPEAQWRAQDLAVHAGATTARVSGGAECLLRIASEGRHFAINAVGVLAMAQALGADLAQSLCGLGAWQPPAGRGQRETMVLDAGLDGATYELIDDAFNANPASLSAALAVLAAAETAARRVAVLGDMYELGPDEIALHRAIADDPALAQIDLVHCVGPRMQALHEALPPHKRGRYWRDAPSAAAACPALLRVGDCVLVKGSKASRVSLVVDALRKLAKREAPANSRD